MRNILKILAIWFLMGMVYFVIEGIWRIPKGGYANISMLAVGGLCGLLIGSINQIPKFYNMSVWRQSVIGTVIVLIIEYNNILACEYGINQLKELSETDYKIDLNQGMDVMMLNDVICEIIKKLKWIKYIRFSCDKEYQLPYFESLVKLFDKYKIAKSKVFIYVLVQKDLESADRRVQELHRICKSFNLYAQAERNTAKGIEPDKLQLEFAQRYVYGRSYKKENFKEYCKRHSL